MRGPEYDYRCKRNRKNQYKNIKSLLIESGKFDVIENPKK